MTIAMGRDPAVLAAGNSLRIASGAADDRVRSAKGTLAGHMGLTGICAGFAIESASQVEKWVRSGKYLTGEDPKIPDHSTSNIQENEKLLISSVFETIGPKDDWRCIRRDWDPKLVAEIQQRFVSHLSKATGAVLLERIPKREFVEMGRIEELLEKVPETDDWDAHYMIEFSNPHEDIFKWHVVYFHPRSGIIADGANFLYWRGSDLSLSAFKKVLASYGKDDYARKFKECSLYKFSFPENPKSLSLFQKYRETFSRTFSIARYQPKLAVRYFVGQSLPDTLAKKLIGFDTNAGSNEFYTSLQDALSAKDYPRFRALVLKRDQRIPDSFRNCKITQDPKELLPLLKWLQGRGVTGKPILSWMLEGVLKNLCWRTDEELSPERHEEFRKDLRSVLELCHKSGNMHVINISDGWFSHISLRPFVEEFLRLGVLGDDPQVPFASALYTACSSGDLDFVKLLVRYGANPMAAFYTKGDNPIDAASKNGHGEVVEFLESQIFFS